MENNKLILKLVRLNLITTPFIRDIVNVYDTIADWIGSNDEFLYYFTEFNTIEKLIKNYFPLSKLRAKRAIKKIGWTGWKSSDKKNQLFSFKKVFPFI